MILERIKAYIDYKGIKVAPFEKSIGMSNASFGKSLKNNGSIGTDKLENILSVYSDINPTWLLTGEGSMLKSTTTSVDRVPLSSPIEPSQSKKSEKTSNAVEATAFLSYMEKKDEAIKEKDAIIEQKNQEITALKCQVTRLEGENQHLIDELDRIREDRTQQPTVNPPSTATPTSQPSDTPRSHTA